MGWEISDASLLVLIPILERLQNLGIRTSIFMDPDVANLEALAKEAKLVLDRIELYTAPYAMAFAKGNYEKILQDYKESAQIIKSNSWGINAGHDLNQNNLATFLQEVPSVLEVSIGHAVIADSIFRGLLQTVQDYKNIIV